MPARFVVSSALLLAAFAVAGPVHQARDPAITSVVPVTTQSESPTVAFTSSIGDQDSVSDWTQVVATSTYLGPWTSSVGPWTSIASSSTVIPYFCPPQVSVATTEIQTSSVSEPSPSTMVVTVAVTIVFEPSPSTMVATVPVTSVSEPSPTTMVVTVPITSVSEPYPSTMVVTVPVTSVSASPNVVTICPSQPAPSSEVFSTTQPVTTQSLVVPTTQSDVAVTTRSAGAQNLLINTNSAMLQVVSVRLAAVATFFGLVGASVTLFV